MQLIVAPDGTTRCVYTEAIDLSRLGRLSIVRGSHVEPTESGEWNADLSPASGPVLGPFAKRSDALAAEVEWLERHFLSSMSHREIALGLSASVPRPPAFS